MRGVEVFINNEQGINKYKEGARMKRYKLQIQVGSYKLHTWADLSTEFATKADVESFIGEYREDYEWRVGWVYKRYDCDDVFRVVKLGYRYEEG